MAKRNNSSTLVATPEIIEAKKAEYEEKCRSAERCEHLWFVIAYGSYFEERYRPFVDTTDWSRFIMVGPESVVAQWRVEDNTGKILAAVEVYAVPGDTLNLKYRV